MEEKKLAGDFAFGGTGRRGQWMKKMSTLGAGSSKTPQGSRRRPVDGALGVDLTGGDVWLLINEVFNSGGSGGRCRHGDRSSELAGDERECWCFTSLEDCSGTHTNPNRSCRSTVEDWEVFRCRDLIWGFF